MKSKTVSYGLATLPRVSAQDCDRLKGLEELSDENIDFSDVPEITPEQAKTAVRGYRKWQTETSGIAQQAGRLNA